MRLSDTASGGLFAAIGVILAVASWRFPTAPMQPVGPGFYPGLLGVLMALLGAIVAVRGLAQREAPVALDEWMRDRPRLWAALALPGAIVTYVGVANLLGFIAGCIAAMMLVGLVWRDRLLPALLLATATSLALFFFFSWGLRVPLPFGPLEGWLSWRL